MQVRTYDEVDPLEVYKLTMVTFGWPLTPESVRHYLRRDPRSFEGYAIYAVERGRPIAQVVPLRIPVRLTSGVETVGGIAGVCSLPTHWGRGYARRLMEHAHGMFRKEGLRIATLTTSRNIRGYHIYRGMGYVDLGAFQQGVRRLPSRKSRPRGLRLRRATLRDLPRIQSLFEAHVRGLYGWTERDPRVLGARVAWDRKDLEGYRMVMRDGQAVGYTMKWTDDNALLAEAIVPRGDDFRGAIRALEMREKRSFAAVRDITCVRDQERYRALGYEFYGPRLGTAMALDLGGRLRPGELPRLFGAPQGRFVLYTTDWF